MAKITLFKELLLDHTASRGLLTFSLMLDPSPRNPPSSDPCDFYRRPSSQFPWAKSEAIAQNPTFKWLQSGLNIVDLPQITIVNMYSIRTMP